MIQFNPLLLLVKTSPLCRKDSLWQAGWQERHTSFVLLLRVLTWGKERPVFQYSQGLFYMKQLLDKTQLPVFKKEGAAGAAFCYECPTL